MENDFSLRLIGNKEIKKAAKIMAECFYDYPLYKTIFPNDKIRLKKLETFYNVSLYMRKSYTYVTDDFSFVGCIKYPKDKSLSTFKALLNPKYFFSTLSLLTPRLIKIYKIFINNSSSMQDKYSSPEKDIFVEAICVVPEARNEINFIEAFKAKFYDKTIFAETCDDNLLKLYVSMGFEKIGEITWQDITNYYLIYSNQGKI